MAKVIRFTLSGNFAFFKKPEVRTGTGYTYNHIHKITLLGILGSVIGLEGYNTHHLRKQLKQETAFFPAFYETLNALKVSIVPLCEYDTFQRDIQPFTDTTMFSNHDGTLLVKEQWLISPAWDVYLLLDGSVDDGIEEKLKEYILNHKTHYLPYLGKNDHPANISNVELVEVEEANGKFSPSSLVPLTEDMHEYLLDEVEEGEFTYCLIEMMPTHLHHEIGNYAFEHIAYTDIPMEGHHWIENKSEQKRHLIFH